jgi:hypothetical protein
VEIVYKELCHSIIFHDVFPLLQITTREGRDVTDVSRLHSVIGNVSENKSTAIRSDIDSWLL